MARYNQKMSGPKRHYVITSFRDEPPQFNSTLHRYLIYQREKCPETGRLHWQGYVELKKPGRVRGTVASLGGECHLDARKGTRDEARDYCRKEESRVSDPVEHGEWIEGQGARSDVHELVLGLKSGKRDRDLLEEFPGLFLRYARGLDRIRAIVDQERGERFRSVHVTVYWGTTGVGKTKRVFDEHGFSSCFKIAADQLQWWDGYGGHDVILIDEFSRGCCGITRLLSILDGYPYRLPVKGGHTWAAYTKVYITSNQHWLEWFENLSEEHQEALERRLTDVVHME